MNKITEAVAYLKSYKKVYVYGAGVRAKRFMRQIKQFNLPIYGFIVTERNNNPMEIDGVKVWQKDEFCSGDLLTEDMIIVVAIAGDKEMILNQLKNYGFPNLYFPSDYIWFLLRMCEKKELYEIQQNKYIIQIEYPLLENYHVMLMERESGQALFRVVNSEFDNLKEETCLKERFEKTYGKIRMLSHEEHAAVSERVLRQYAVEMYVVTSHFDKTKVEDMRLGGFTLIQVGADLTDIRKDCLCDNTGDNISCKNQDYCECTAIYWLWKNTKHQKYVGISHYRRRLMLCDDIVKELENKKIKAIMPVPEFCSVNVKHFMEQFIRKEDWNYLKEAVMDYDIEYRTIFEQYENTNYFFPCNIFLFERSWFDRYCEFAFFVTQKIENEYLRKNIIREDRYLGFIFENLTSVFVMRYYEELNVHCLDVEWIE